MSPNELLVFPYIRYLPTFTREAFLYCRYQLIQRSSTGHNIKDCGVLISKCDTCTILLIQKPRDNHRKWRREILKSKCG